MKMGKQSLCVSQIPGGDGTGMRGNELKKINEDEPSRTDHQFLSEF